jgi:lipid II:glycine glycyltransferase (peptidoglycan interpeptide bridge formation enzyme)
MTVEPGVRQDHLNAIIELENKDKVWDNLYEDKRKGIKKASKKFRIEIKEQTNEEGVELFYGLIVQLFKRKRHSVKPKEYFQNLIKFSGGNIRILFAYYESKAISTQLFTIYKDKIRAMYTATLDEHRNKHAGDLLVWRMIEIGFENNIRIFDFGGGGDPNIRYSPREYKERFGTTFTNTGRWVYKKSALYSIIMWLYKFLLKK